MVHKAWVLDIKIDGYWIPGRLLIGGHPIKSDWVPFFANTFNFDINNVRIRRIKSIKDYKQICADLSSENPKQYKEKFKNSAQIVQLALNIKEDDEIYFNDGKFVFENNEWIEQ